MCGLSSLLSNEDVLSGSDETLAFAALFKSFQCLTDPHS